MFIHLPMKELQVLKLQVKSLFGDCVVDVKFLFHSGVLLKLTFTFLCISLNMLLFITPYRSSWLGNIFDVVWDVIGVGVDVDVSSCARMSNEPKPRDLFDCTPNDVRLKPFWLFVAWKRKRWKFGFFFASRIALAWGGIEKVLRVEDVRIPLIRRETERSGCACIWRRDVWVFLHICLNDKMVDFCVLEKYKICEGKKMRCIFVFICEVNWKKKLHCDRSATVKIVTATLKNGSMPFIISTTGSIETPKTKDPGGVCVVVTSFSDAMS